MKNKILLVFFSVYTFSVFGQEKKIDSIMLNLLSEVVVTGQFKPQSIKKSVFNVTKITRATIEQQAANNLSDLLNQYLNMTIAPSSGTGRSTISMFGLDGQYFKILIDNVPLVSDTTLGNNVDLTQVNLNNVEQIEIIEGSMGVTNGANAVGGILNIITKKSSLYKWEINATLQEETVGEEYSLFDEGRHIQVLKVSNSISDHWYASMGLNRNDFGGYLGDKEGKDYSETDLKRGHTWLPKQQYIGNGMIHYKKGDFKAFLKLDYLYENLDYYNPIVLVIANPPFGDIRYSKDQRYKTERFINQLNCNGKLWQQLYFTLSASYQKQTRNTEYFDYNIKSETESNSQDNKNQSTEILYSTGTLSNFFPQNKVDFQFGYEFTNNLSYALIDGEEQTKVPLEKRFDNYDFFLSSEIKATSKLAIRPGARISFQSQFDTQYAASLGFYYLLNNGLEWRASLGTSFRTPNFEELYSKIKFSSHNFYGNENLIPETSLSYDFSVKTAMNFESGIQLSSNLSLTFLDIKDKIDMAYVGSDIGTNAPIYQFINISFYNMGTLASSNQLVYKNWSGNVGFSITGLSQEINNGEMVSDDKFLYYFQFNSAASYNWLKYSTLFSIYYKYNGEKQQFVGAVTNGQNNYELSTIEAYSFLDASIRKSFYKKQFDVTFGARNILDIKNIQQSIAAGGAHTASTDILLGYGRSCFLKLTYNFNL